MKDWNRFGLFVWLWLAAAAFGETNSASPLELHVKKVLFIRLTQSPVVILVDKEERRFLPIWIGMNEAQAIALEMENFKPPRPMTHDLFPSVVKELGGTIERVVITETKANTYYATLSINAKGATKVLDCRPSDGIAIALRAKVPILASETVMKNAMPVPEGDEETDGAQRVKQLAITVQTLTPDLAEAMDTGTRKGVLVSASQEPKLERGDVITAVGSQRVTNTEELVRALVAALEKGKEVEVKIARHRQIMTVRITIAASATPRD